MSLFENMMQPCQIYDKVTETGPFGVVTTWKPGALTQAAIVKDDSLTARVAEKEGVTEIYTITAPAGTPLDFHDVVKRLKDGETFRITSNAADTQPPAVASFSFVQVTAERWNIPK